MSEQKKYHSAFKRVCVNEDGGKKIKELQEEFDKFWRKMHKFADKSPEKFHAQKAMQEACMWLSRGCALKHERVPEIIIDDPLARVIESVESTGFKNTIGKHFGKLTMKPGDTITNNGIRIVVKKSKK